jgi:hypothetical protein
MSSRRFRPVRMLLGFAAAPFVAAFISLGSYEAFWHGGFLPQGAPVHSIDAAQSLFAGVMILAGIMTLSTAVPGVLWLNRRGWLTFGKVVLLGAVAGNLPFVLIIIGIVVVQIVAGTSSADIPRYWEGLSGTAVRSMMGTVGGAGAAATFWLVGVCGTPNDGRPAAQPVDAS